MSHPQSHGDHGSHDQHGGHEPPKNGSTSVHAGHGGRDEETAPHEHASHHAHAREHASDMPAASNGGEHAGHDKHAGDGGHGGHDKHAGHDPEAFRRLFWLSLLLTIPVVIFSEMVQDWFGYSLSGVPGNELVAPVLGTVVFVYGGRVFLRGAWDEIRFRQPGMMLLIAMAITVAFVSSIASELGWLDLEFWWELAALITVMQLGHWQEMRALGRTRGALDALAELLPDEAERVEGDDIVRVAISDLREGDIVLVRPGARVPGDGIVVDGRADFDESMLTGESRPVLRAEGERVAAGTVAHGSAVRVRVDALGETTALAGIRRMVEEAQSSNSKAQAIADRAAAWLFAAAVGAGLLTFAGWSFFGEVDQAVVRTVTVLVIACPHALGLAIPLVIAISTEVAAKSGILVKDRLALERMRNIDVVLFDKTGTLTEGRPEVTGAWAADGDEDALLRLAGSAEVSSEHPLATAIVRRAREGGDLLSARDFAADAGRGVTALVDDVPIAVGGPRLVAEAGVDIAALPSERAEAWSSRGATILYVLRDGRLAGALALEDRVRDASFDAVEALHGAGIRVAMVTGDARAVADSVAARLNIDEVFAEVLPEHKADQVRALQQRGHRVAMVGDGVNDAPALAQADVGIAIGAGTDVAIESAGVVLASDDPRAVLGVVKLSHGAYRKMVQNLIWATGYNVLAIPVAADVFAFAGVVMPPAIAAVLMSLSTIIVAGNAQLLRRMDLSPEPEATPDLGRDERVRTAPAS